MWLTGTIILADPARRDDRPGGPISQGAGHLGEGPAGTIVPAAPLGEGPARTIVPASAVGEGPARTIVPASALGE